jgi:hypothetical protein
MRIRIRAGKNDPQKKKKVKKLAIEVLDVFFGGPGASIA